MVDVLGLHGIGQQQQGRNQLLPRWQAALNDGVERAKGYGWPTIPSLDLAYYGDLFLPETDSKGTAAVDDQGSAALDESDYELFPDVEGDTSDDLMSFFGNVEDELIEREFIDPTEKLDEDKDKGRLPPQVSRLAAWLERKFGVAGQLLFIGDLAQVRRFQQDDGLASAVRDRVCEVLQHQPRVLIGHSLGSVVAYEALCLIPDHGITALITVGSPLGLRSIREALRSDARDRIPKLPPGIARWVNVYDRGDPVALAGGLAEYWPAVEDMTVYNGEKEPHGIGPYLGKKEVGQAVADALT